MSSTTPLTDAINALTTYANEVTGQSDATLSDAVGSLVDGYGGGNGYADYMVENMKNTLITYFATGVTHIRQNAIRGLTSLTALVIPDVSDNLQSYTLGYVTNMEKLDVGANVTRINSRAFSNSSSLNALILRKSTVLPLDNVNAFEVTPFANGQAGGTLYVPQALISSYQSANNWSTILGYSTNSIEAIEGSIYETQYADGTPISIT